jgi:hypothetical protein
MVAIVTWLTVMECLSDHGSVQFVIDTTLPSIALLWFITIFNIVTRQVHIVKQELLTFQE